MYKLRLTTYHLLLTHHHPKEVFIAVQRANGRLQLQFHAASPTAPTTLHISAQEPPLRVVRAFTGDDGVALVHLHNVSGGVLGGDHLMVEAELSPYARALLTTTGATRVYRQRSDQAEAVQATCLAVRQGALLEYLPDPLIPFADARYRQTTRIELGPDAGLFYWEIVTPGREARGEVFQYAALRLDLDILTTTRPIAVERVQLEPAQRSLASLARLGPYRYYATFYICRVGLPPTIWLALERQLTEMTQSLTELGQVIWGVSTLSAHGLVVRGASRTNRRLTSQLPCFWRLAKKELYAAEAVLPRKIY